MTTKESLHRLVDQLPDVALPEAERYLAARRDDPLALLLLTAPVDEEPETDEEREAVQQAREAAERGEVVSDEDLDRELGW